MKLSKYEGIVLDTIRKLNGNVTVRDLCEHVILPEKYGICGIYHRILPVCLRLEKMDLLVSVIEGKSKVFSIKTPS